MINSKNLNNSEKLITLKEASELLRCHPNTLRQWDRKGILKAVRFGVRRDRKYKKKEILDLIRNNNLKK